MSVQAIGTSALGLILSLGLSMASPIEEPISTPAEARAAGVIMNTQRFDGADPTISFKVTWTPDSQLQDETFPPGMSLIQYAKDDKGAVTRNDKLHVRYELQRDGRCRADFTIAESELRAAELRFWLSQQTAYRLLLSDFKAITTPQTALGENNPASPPHRVLPRAITRDLPNAQTIAIGDFSEPDGIVITRIIRGGADKKVGQRWNSTAFPRGPVLIYERTSDTIGDHPGVISATGHYPLDETKRFVVLESRQADTGWKEKLLIPLEEVLKALEAK